MRPENRNGALFALLVLVFLLAYYATVRGQPVDLVRLNKSTAIGSVVLVALSFLLGPLARLGPWFVARLPYRKPLGLWGFAFAALHIALSLSLPQYMTYFDLNAPAYVFGAVAFAMFAFIAGTGTDAGFRALGFERWQSIQRTGYLALLLAVVHFYLIEAREFASLSLAAAPPGAAIALLFGLLALLARLITLLLPRKKLRPRARARKR
jgi:sulfoxide reductase heme-binding subunit YedZ